MLKSAKKRPIKVSYFVFPSNLKSFGAESIWLFIIENKKRLLYNRDDEIPDLNENWSPSFNRVNYLLSESDVDPKTFYENHMKEIAKCRKSESYKKSHN